MALKKSDLYSSLWASCDELRGGMDASQYKDYVLFMLFIKYISDKYADSDDFAPPVIIPKGASFRDMIALKGKPDIGDKINTEIIQPIIDANSRLARTDFPDFNDPNKLGEGQAMVDRLTNLVAIFQKPELDFSKNRADGDDLLGDAYEFLMRHFAIESGKSKGQFLTPSEVSEVLSLILGIEKADLRADTTAYDPTCGSASLLLKLAFAALHSKGVRITLYGQEKDVTTAGLARMNMILHDFPTANILSGNTLAAPKFKDGEQLMTFDYAAANPPFSDKTWSTGLVPEQDPFQRFQAYGVPPAKQGDYAYLLHIIRSLKSTGKGACILPHGVLFRGNAEAVIRRKLVQSGIIKGIIGLPANLFYGTGIPACIIVIDKENATARKGIFMVDASKGFIKDGPKNRLRAQDIHKIVDTFTRQDGGDPRYARMVPFSEICDPRNDFNLNLPRYIDSTEPEDIQDINGHLRGGIPEHDIDALGAYWTVLPAVRQLLFGEDLPVTPPLPKGMHPAYAETHFEIQNSSDTWPDEFAIITACATTGESWTQEQNDAADFELEQELRKISKWVQRATGYSPTTGHTEPGWAVSLAFNAACDIGVRFRQDAIYYVNKTGLAVSYCDARRAPVVLGPFKPRLHVAGQRSRIRLGYRDLQLPIAEVKPAIFGHSEFTAFKTNVDKLFAKWKTTNISRLKEFAADANSGNPKALIATLSEDLLTAFAQAPLLDHYDIYQHLMDYWAETMQDDCYLIAADGWREAAKPKLIVEDKAKKATKEKPDFAVGKKKYKTELIPSALVIARYFAKEQAAIEKLETDIAGLQQQMEELAEEHGGEGGLLEDAKNDKEKLTKASVAARLKDIQRNADAADERELLADYLRLIEEEAIGSTKLKAAQENLMEAILRQYAHLTAEDIKTLLVNDKWVATLATAVQGELDRVSQTLTSRIRLLADRYATPLPQLVDEVATLAAKVDAHLKKMEAASR